MPNWSFNTFAVKGKKNEVIDFFNQAIKEHRNRELLTNEMSGQEIVTRLNEIHNSKHPIHLRSWLPMPKTFVKWDTTNQIKEFENWKNEKLGIYGFHKPTKSAINKFNALSSSEQKAEYDKYVIGWNKAKVVQQNMYGCVGWYEYNLKTLGTKWDANIEDFLYDECGDELIIRMYCETAWSFPDNWLDTMQKKTPNLTFFCYAWEESYEYCGYFKATDTDWVENYGRNLYDDCVSQVQASEDYNADEEDEKVYELVCEKEDEMYSKFHDYVINFAA